MRRLLVIPLALILLLAGAMFWSAGAGVEQPADFRFINRGEISTLDPRRMSWLEDIRIGYALWEGLYALDPVTLEAIPGAASHAEVSEDRTIYTFHLRPEARWTNGDPVVAGDFVFAWRRMLEEPGDYSYLLHYIKGAKEYQESFERNGARASDFATVGAKVIDHHTLRVTLVHPVAFFLDLVAFPPYFPLHAASMERFASLDAATGRTTYRREFTRPPHLVTNGAYELKAWDFKRRLRMVASEHYWDRKNVRSRIIDMVMVEDKTASYEMYNAGAVDWLAEVTSDIAAELLALQRADLRVFPAFGTYFYILNCQETLSDGRKNPLHDSRVRRALALALDKQPIVDTITRLGEPVSTTFIPPGAFKGYNSPEGLPFDIARARALLADAGYPSGRGFPSVSILYNKEMQHAEIAQYARSQWLQNLGIDVALEGVERSIFADRRHNREFIIGRGSWFGDYNDPSTFTDMYLSSSGNNDSGWFNKDYDALCAAAAVEVDPVKRLRYFEQAENLLLEEAAILPVYTYVNKILFRDNVKGISLHPRNMVNFKFVEVER